MNFGIHNAYVSMMIKSLNGRIKQIGRTSFGRGIYFTFTGDVVKCKALNNPNQVLFYADFKDEKNINIDPTTGAYAGADLYMVADADFQAKGYKREFPLLEVDLEKKIIYAFSNKAKRERITSAMFTDMQDIVTKITKPIYVVMYNGRVTPRSKFD